MGLLELELEQLLKHSNDNIVITDGQGIVLRSSPNCQEIYGKNVQYLIGKTVHDLQKEDIFKPSVTLQVLNEKKEVQVMQRTNTGRIVMATGIPVFDNDKNIIRVISFSHDLTEIEQMNADYEQLQIKMKHYETEIEELRTKDTNIDGIVIQSTAMKKIWHLIRRMAASDANVVLYGETGVGKSVFARALHKKSDRSKNAFIEVNCGAIPENLFESELFGYEQGAFTGASQKGKLGLIELAHQGTLFLDEIAEISLDHQVKLLKVLEEKVVTRVGGSTAIEVDFRLVTATNRNLSDMVKSGTFREDLYYRLNVIPIDIPALRDRKEDIYHLVHYYLTYFNEKYQTDKVLSTSTIDVLQQYNWPGNVRELENLIERLIVTCDQQTIHPMELPFKHQNRSPITEQGNDVLEAFEQQGMTLKEHIQQVEKEWLQRAYRQYKTTYEMADYLGISQATVVRRLKKYQINSK